MTSYWLPCVLLIIAFMPGRLQAFGVDINSTQEPLCSMEPGDKVMFWGHCRVLPVYKSSFCNFTYPGRGRSRQVESDDCPLRDPRNPRRFTKNGTLCRGRHPAAEGETGQCACVNGTQACVGKTYFLNHHPLCASRGFKCPPSSSATSNRALLPMILMLSFLLMIYWLEL